MKKIKILAVSDIHCNLKFCLEICEKVETEKPDLITISGDSTNFGSSKEMKIVMKNLPDNTPIP